MKLQTLSIKQDAHIYMLLKGCSSDKSCYSLESVQDTEPDLFFNGFKPSYGVHLNGFLTFDTMAKIVDYLRSASKGDDIENFVERMYKLYPSKCPMRNIYLGKTNKDKDRIRKLLKTYSEEEIEKVIRKEIEEKYGKHYMQNFSTFLNNFPDPNSLFSEPQQEEISTPKDDLIINGQIYR